MEITPVEAIVKNIYHFSNEQRSKKFLGKRQ